MNKAVFLDTNVLIDLVDAHRQHHEQAAQLLVACAETGVEVYGCASSLKDVYYIACRHYLSEAEARKTIVDLAGVVSFEGLSVEDVLDAAQSDEPDVEDGIIRVVAERSGAEAIVTRDAKAFQGSALSHLTPEEWLERQGF